MIIGIMVERAILLLVMVGLTTTLSAQFVAIREMKEPVEGVCDNSNVHAMLLFDGQKQQECSMPKPEVEALLNQEVTYLQKDPKFKLKKHESVSTMVNCKGELVLVELDTKSAEFNEQVCEVFRSMDATWTAGSLDGKPVDSVQLWGIEINKGRIVLR